MATQSFLLNGAELLPLVVKVKEFYKARVKVLPHEFRPYTKTFSVMFVNREDAMEFAKKQIEWCVERECLSCL